MKKFLTLILTFAMLCTLTPAYAASFTDTAGHWAGADIEAMAAAGVVNGYDDGSFRPDAPVTRAEFAKILTELYGLPTGDYGWYFYGDVEPGQWYTPYVPAYCVLVDLPLAGMCDYFGWPRSWGDDYFYDFAPQRPLTRIEAAQALDYITGSIEDEEMYDFLIELGLSTADSPDYADNPGISLLAGSVMFKQLMNGDDQDRFRPYDTISRAEVCTLLNRAVNAYDLDDIAYMDVQSAVDALAEAYFEEEGGGYFDGVTAGGDFSDWALEVLDLVNAERAKEGAAPLELDADLCAVAQLHSNDMVARGFFDHYNPDGLSPFDRMSAYGIRYMAAGENIAAGQRSPEAVMNSWMNSPGHRSNILNPSYKKMGIAWADGGDYGIYWTQCFTD